jgi:hypothetical protein
MGDHEYPVPRCPECKGEFCLSLSYSDIYGCCIQCQNCNEDFPLEAVGKLYKNPKGETGRG